LEMEDEVSEELCNEEIQKYLLGIKEGLNYESSFLVSDNSRRYYTYQGIHKLIDPEHDEYDRWYTDFLSLNQEYAYDVDIDDVHQNIMTVFTNVRITDKSNNKLLGVCGVGFHMNKSQELFYELEDEYHVKINLIDADHLILVDTDINKIEKEHLNNIDLTDAYATKEYVYQDFGNGRYAVTKYLEGIDWFLVVQNDGTSGGGNYLNAVLLNILLFGIVTAIMAYETHKIMKSTSDLSDASFKDNNTGLLNRRAFEEEKNELSNKVLNENLVYLIADLNGLKAANDTIGHHAGDELINGTASCLKKVLAPYGKIYRIGGDEFAAILYIPKDELAKVQSDLKKEFDSWSGDEVKELSVSCGYAPYREHPSESISGLSKIADELMYKEKEEYYRTSGKDRRRV
ncbi:MAG: GGDEF domain-containing protein, partial [Erysipelotrichaceae bacterium]|nr:GGDEF domain-containing protein [Erysipelotrichaceae bacterium]